MHHQSHRLQQPARAGIAPCIGRGQRKRKFQLVDCIGHARCVAVQDVEPALRGFGLVRKQKAAHHQVRPIGPIGRRHDRGGLIRIKRRDLRKQAFALADFERRVYEFGAHLIRGRDFETGAKPRQTVHQRLGPGPKPHAMLRAARKPNREFRPTTAAAERRHGRLFRRRRRARDAAC